MKRGNKFGLGCLGVVIVGGLAVIAIVSRPDPVAEEQRIQYAMASYCQTAVRDRLKAPAAAEFQAPRNSDIAKLAAGRYKITSYVDAQNGFGAKVRTAYVCTVEGKDAEFRIAELEIDGRR